MDRASEKAQVEDELKFLELWLDHKTTREVFSDLREQSEAVLRIILEQPITDLETFFSREQAMGHLRGLRHVQATIQDKVQEQKAKLKTFDE